MILDSNKTEDNILKPIRHEHFSVINFKIIIHLIYNVILYSHRAIKVILQKIRRQQQEKGRKQFY